MPILQTTAMTTQPRRDTKVVKCVIHDRVRRADRSDLAALSKQIHGLHQYAAERNWSVKGAFMEIGGTRDRSRPTLTALLRRCSERPPVQVVLVDSGDRLVQRLPEFVNLRAQFARRGVPMIMPRGGDGQGISLVAERP